jgi:replication factor A1
MPRETRGRRGRRPRNTLSYKNSRILEYLAKIAVKYDSSALWVDIRKAWNHGEAECQKLSIWCRERKKESAMFLFTTGPNVVAQFPIPTTLLQRSNQLEPYMKQIRSSLARDSRVLNPRIKDLKVGMKKIDLKAKVLQIPTPKRILTRFGTIATLSNVLIGDETGTITMTLWNQRIQMVAKGDRITIENGSVASFRGERQLRIGRKSASLNVIN